MDSGFYVYRFLNMDNKVLYVGRTHNLDQRFIKINKVTKANVIKLASKIHLDTIYLLEGETDEEK